MLAVRIAEESFDPVAEEKAFLCTAGIAGASVAFVGSVRAEQGAVTGLELECWPGRTERLIRERGEAVIDRFGLDALLVVHRVGTMAPGEPIVQVVAHARHRRAAFEGVDCMMDYLKTEALFWKKELRGDDSEWIEPRAQDYDDAARWEGVSRARH